MNTQLRITVVVGALAGILTGGILGAYTARQNEGIVESARVIAASSATAAFAAEQFRHADPEHARQAVMLQIDILQQFERLSPSSVHENNLGFAYTRLAMIDKTAGQEVASEVAFQQAKDWFQKVHPESRLTSVQMESFVRHLEKVRAEHPRVP